MPRAEKFADTALMTASNIFPPLGVVGTPRARCRFNQARVPETGPVLRVSAILGPGDF